MRVALLVIAALAVCAGACSTGNAADAASASSAGSETLAGRTLTEWTAQVNSENRVVRLRAVKTLPAFGNPAIPALTQALEHADPAVRFWAADGLGTIAPEADQREGEDRAQRSAFDAAVPVLKAMLDEKSGGVRMAAAFALCRLGEVETGLPELIRAIEHPERGVANSAVDFVARVGPPAREAIPALEAAIERNQRGRPGGDYHIASIAREAIRRIRGEAATDEREPE
ncbi:MAG TPA: HEAT repeat domain-containing protein [Planctomycetaceae bacterium]|nr:HEAT repeat domain-containing protein [Planctomycetaceae bacterium]